MVNQHAFFESASPTQSAWAARRNEEMVDVKSCSLALVTAARNLEAWGARLDSNGP